MTGGSMTDRMRGVALVISCLSIIFALLCALWVFKNMSSKIVIASQPLFLFFIIAGCVISTSTVFALIVDDQVGPPESGDTPEHALARADGACMATPWLYVTIFHHTRRSQHLPVLVRPLWRLPPPGNHRPLPPEGY